MIDTAEKDLTLYRNELVNIIKDFTTDKCKLRTFKDTRQTSEGTDLSNKTYSYRDVIHLIEKHTKMSEQDKQKMIVKFWTCLYAMQYLETGIDITETGGI